MLQVPAGLQKGRLPALQGVPGDENVAVGLHLFQKTAPQGLAVEAVCLFQQKGVGRGEHRFCSLQQGFFGFNLPGKIITFAFVRCLL